MAAVSRGTRCRSNIYVGLSRMLDKTCFEKARSFNTPHLEIIIIKNKNKNKTTWLNSVNYFHNSFLGVGWERVGSLHYSRAIGTQLKQDKMHIIHSCILNLLHAAVGKRRCTYTSVLFWLPSNHRWSESHTNEL